MLTQGKYPSVCIIADENTHRDCLPILAQQLGGRYPVIRVPHGEEHKNLDTCRYIWQRMLDLGLGRRSLVINLGGGVVGDMGGFCAATFKRGIAFVQAPTTLLAQVDASVGGKLGVDFLGAKNMIGVFRQPEAVIIDPVFLKTLPEREIRSGYAEILKHALIADKEQWQTLPQPKNWKAVDWTVIIEASVGVKRRIVELDPLEAGIRKALNFGHTIGHAVESVYLGTDSRLLHGEAVAVGMVCEAYLSTLLMGLPVRERDAIAARIIGLYGKHGLEEGRFHAMLELMGKDKKNEGTEINFTLLPHIGAAEVNQSATPEQIIESLRYYNRL